MLLGRGLLFKTLKHGSGDLCTLVPPVPFPNTEVKRGSGDDSCGATHRENTSSPEPCFKKRHPPKSGDFLWLKIIGGIIVKFRK